MILLIEPFSTNIDMFIPAYPLPLVEIASFIKSRKKDIEIEIRSLSMDYGIPLNSTGKARIYKKLADDIVRLNPQAVGISCTAIAQADETLALCESIRSWVPETFIFIGGYFPSIYYEEILKRSTHIDLVIIGEGEEPALKVIDCLEKKQNPKKMDIPGLAWRDGKQIHVSAPPQRFNLRHKALLNLNLLKHPEHYQVLPYSFSRGCPHRCSFCMEDVLRPQRRSVPKAIVEGDLHNMEAWSGVHTLLISDALFKSFDYFPLLRGLQKKVNFETRCDALDPNLLDQFPDVVGILALGLESASYQSLRRMNKIRDRAHYQRYLAQAEAIFNRAVANEIPIMVFMIAGYPGDREQDLQESLAFVKRLSQTKGDGGYIFKIGETRVYPKTRIYDWALKEPGVFVEKMSVFGESVVRRPSWQLDFNTVEAYMQAIFSRSHATALLNKRLGKLMPFFRLPIQAMGDASIPDACFVDQQRNIINTQGKHLDTFRKHLPILKAKYKTGRAGQRSTRTLAL